MAGPYCEPVIRRVRNPPNGVVTAAGDSEDRWRSLQHHHQEEVAMHVQASTTTLHRGPAYALLAAFAALAIAGGTVGVIAITSNDGNSVQSPAPSVARVAPDRVLDGSPILRGTANTKQLYGYRHAIAPASLRTASSTQSRVLDGSPILRGHVAAATVTNESSVQGTSRPPEARPMGFGFTP
jgi:hypothetical protein